MTALEAQEGIYVCTAFAKLNQQRCVSVRRPYGCAAAAPTASRRGHRDGCMVPDDTLLPPGFGELFVVCKKIVMYSGTDGRAICARVLTQPSHRQMYSVQLCSMQKAPSCKAVSHSHSSWCPDGLQWQP